jgi:tRNA1(Val) A37 N6-methylase TrmN6
MTGTPLASASDDPTTLDRLTRDFWLYQRKRGHRFSSDDLVTAWAALQAKPHPRRVLDLGCGIGSVLLHIAWSVPDATLVGVEAQAISFALLTRNLEHNHVEGRVVVHHGDLRDAGVIARLGEGFDLVTGTPPYFPPSAALDAIDMQRAYARVEYRGGVEAYIATAARVMARDGTLVLCGDADAEARVDRAVGDVGLCRVARWRVVPRAGEPALFAVWAMRFVEEHVEDRTLTLRDAHGARTADAKMLRAFSGIAE